MDTATEYCPLDKVFFPLSVEFGESLAQNNIVIHVSNAAIIETSGEVGYERATVFKYNKTSRGKKPFHILFEDGVMSRWGWEEVASPQLRFLKCPAPSTQKANRPSFSTTRRQPSAVRRENTFLLLACFGLGATCVETLVLPNTKTQYRTWLQTLAAMGKSQRKKLH